MDTVFGSRMPGSGKSLTVLFSITDNASAYGGKVEGVGVMKDKKPKDLRQRSLSQTRWNGGEGRVQRRGKSRGCRCCSEKHNSVVAPL
jgi:hypothetical protein